MKIQALTADKKNVNAIIETPRGSRNKFDHDPQTGLYKFSKALPLGTLFPVDFGFIPGTKGGDGDPLDIMILMEGITYPGCLVECRLLGVMKIVQKNKGEKKEERNDRILAVPVEWEHGEDLKSVSDINESKIKELAAFLNYYKQVKGNESRLLSIKGPRKAMQIVKRSLI